MKPLLARVLIERKIIKYGTILEANYNARGISGQLDQSVSGSFRLIGAKSVGELVFFETLGQDNARYKVRCDNVIAVDGMPLPRLAQSQSLTLEGVEAISDYKKRKRKEEELDDDFDHAHNQL